MSRSAVLSILKVICSDRRPVYVRGNRVDGVGLGALTVVEEI